MWTQGEACYYGRSTEFTSELRFQPQDHPGDLTQILEANLLCLLNDHWWCFPQKFHPQASLWWRSPSAWQAQSTHTISGARRSIVGEDIIDYIDILVALNIVVVLDVHIIVFNMIDSNIHVDINIAIDLPETQCLGITSSSGERTTCGQATQRIVPSYTSGWKNCPRLSNCSTMSKFDQRFQSIQPVS